MKFIETIKQSIYSPSFYRSVPELPFSASVRYFIWLALLQSIISIIILPLFFGSSVNLFTGDLKDSFLSDYPDDLIITIKDGRASSNVTEPHRFPLSASFRENADQAQEFSADLENFLVIETNKEFDLENFRSHKTIVLLSAAHLALLDGYGKIQVQPLEKFPDLVINQTNLESFLNKIQPFLKFITPILLPVLFLVGFVGFVIGLAIYLLAIALLVWVLTRSQGLTFGYKKSYQASLHLVTFAVLVDLSFLVLGLPATPYLFTILTLAAALWNFLVKPEPRA